MFPILMGLHRFYIVLFLVLLLLAFKVVNVMVEETNNGFIRHFPELIRLSVGTAIVLGLLEGKLDAQPTTAYLMTYKTGKCSSNCSFCPQARSSQSSTELLSRVTWPNFPTAKALNMLDASAKQGKI